MSVNRPVDTQRNVSLHIVRLLQLLQTPRLTSRQATRRPKSEVVCRTRVTSTSTQWVTEPVSQTERGPTSHVNRTLHVPRSATQHATSATPCITKTQSRGLMP
ncbi:uncharacterized protein LOC121376874 [Gigantopelta aegis]|uniref:uncharacterized protein LOC121376874 n=1 Tax=Gigantopelta aegis TaxID=1735272 RepID=UPI001B88AE3F|nr:uncharacterized protein LOC121376874 [Gigantopelta aegis]